MPRMRKQHSVGLDRLFARSHWGVAHAGARSEHDEHGEWSSPWRPLGRWWMRARMPRQWWIGAGATMRSWQRLIRPSRHG